MTANRLVRHNIRTVLTGSCGPKAFQELQAAGIEVVLNAQGTVRQALASLKKGELSQASKSNVSSQLLIVKLIRCGPGGEKFSRAGGPGPAPRGQISPAPRCGPGQPR